MDISRLSISELRALQEEIPVEIKKREVADRQNVRAELEALAKARGYDLEDIVGKALLAKKRGVGAFRTVPAKYRHPENIDLAWSGRGRQPKWVSEWLSQGKTLAELKAST